jgi:hypothetical protein
MHRQGQAAQALRVRRQGQCEPPDEAAEVVSEGGEDGVAGVAVAAGEITNGSIPMPVTAATTPRPNTWVIVPARPGFIGGPGWVPSSYKRHGTTTLQHPRWHCHRPQHAAPSPPGVHPLSQYDRGAGPRGKSDPRSRRQLHNAQTSKGAAMAGAPSALDHPLHPDLGILAQRGRRVLRQAYGASGSSAAYSNPSLTCNSPSIASSQIPTPTPNPSFGRPIQNVRAAIKRGKQTLESIH